MKILEYKMVKILDEPMPVCPYCMRVNEPPTIKMHEEIKCERCGECFEWNVASVRRYNTWTKEPSE